MLELSEQKVISTQDQVFVNCAKCGYRQNLKPSELADPLNVVCHGPDCKDKFSVKDGIINAIVSDNDFMSWCFISDTMISGQDMVPIGTAKEIKLSTPIKDGKKAFIMQVTQFEPGDIVYFSHKIILPDNFVIVSAGNERVLGKPCEVKWVIYADVKDEDEEAWREYLQHAKESLINQNFQTAIIEAEIAVEVTIANVLWELLTKHKHLSDEVAEWILSRVQAASERAKKVMELAIGKKVSDIDPAIYKKWVRTVAQKRNRIVHRGELATKEEAVEAIKNAFEIIWLLLELVDKKPFRT